MILHELEKKFVQLLSEFEKECMNIGYYANDSEKKEQALENALWIKDDLITLFVDVLIAIEDDDNF